MNLRKYLLLLFIVSISHFIAAQERLNNSAGFSNIEFKDSGSLSARLKEAKQVEKISLDSAYMIYQEILKGSMSISYSKGVAWALAMMGNIYRLKSEYDQSILFLQRAADTAQKYGGGVFVIAMHSVIASVYAQKGSYGISVIYQYKALSQMKKYKVDNVLTEVELYTNLGYNWLYLNEYKLGLSYLDSAERIVDRVKSSSTSLARTIATGDPYIAIARAKAYIEMDSAAEAIRACSKALEQAEKLDDDRMKLYSMVYLGSAYISSGQMEKGFSCLNKAATIRAQNPDFESILVPDLYLASAYRQKGDYSVAKRYLLRLLPLLKDNSMKMMAYSELMNVYAAEGNYKEAYNTQNNFFDMQDSLMNFEKGQAIDILLEYQASEKDKEISQKQLTILQQESKLKQKNLWIGAIITTSLLLIVLVLSWLRSYRLKQKMALQALEQEQKIGRLEALMQGEEKERKRIARELHDGIGSLISTAKMHLRSKSDIGPGQNGFESGMQLLDEAYHELRLTAHNLVPEQLLEQGLVHAVEAYCRRVSRPPEFKVICLHFGAKLELPQKQELTLYRMIQELVHNAIKHGKATEVVIHINNHERLNISVEDNGSGLPEKESVDKGSGLFHLRQRLLLWGGGIEIDSRPGMGITVYIDFEHASTGAGNQN